MRTPLLLPALLLCTGLAAQCPFVPAIDPPAPILCPGGTATLGTGVYESYQWYKDGQAIPGADQRTLQVHQSSDAGSVFAVEAGLDGCTAMSDGVLVDGWVFLLPFVMHDGDEPIILGPNGEPTYCEGANVIFHLGLPYTENIVWTRDGVPIPGEDSTSLVVTVPGSYSVSGAPAVCPDHIVGLGLTIDVTFMPPVKPYISPSGEALCAQPAGVGYQWYRDGVALPGENGACTTPDGPGAYTVYVEYFHGCQEISDPYFTTGIAAPGARKPWSLYPNPGNGLVTVAWDTAPDRGTYWSVLDAAGREVRGGFTPAQGGLMLDLADLPQGTYFFQAAQQGKALAPAIRFTLLR